jgi:transcriptional regulator with XRE-family HTH domain
MIHEKKLLRALGRQIKAARKARGVTQERLAELCGYDPTYISLLETGRRNPPFLTICKLADELDCPLKRLFEEID